MALHDVFMRVQFSDDANRKAEVRYLLINQYDDVTPNWADIVTQAGQVEVQLNLATMDHIDFYTLELVLGGGGAAPNDAATNGEYAFIRTTVPLSGGAKKSIIVPAWDTLLYEEDTAGVLDAAFDTVAGDLLQLLRDPDTGNAMVFEYAQARQRKVFKKNLG